MKNSRNVLRATTALVVSLSFLGSHAVANEATLAQLSLAQSAQVLPKHAEGKAKGKEKQEAAAEEGAAEQTAEEAAASAEAAAEEAEQVAQTATETAEQLPLTEEEAAAETSAEAGASTEEAAAEEPVTEETTEATATGETEAAAEGEATAGSTGTEGDAAAEAETTAETPAEEPAAETAAETPVEEPAAETTAADGEPAAEPEAETTAAETESPAETTAEGEPVMMEATTSGEASTETTETTETTTETSTEAAASGETEVVEEVTEKQIEEATSKGDDVVVEEKTTTEELQSQMQTTAADASSLDDAEPVEVEEEVVTEETSRSSDEEAQVTLSAESSSNDDDDDNDIWKYLGAAAAGAAVGALIPALGGRLVQNQGDRMIVERDGEFYVRKDENVLLRQPGVRVQTENFPDGLTRTTMIREDGSRVVTIRDQGGFILRRTRIMPDGTEYVLIDDTPQQIYSFTNWDEELPPLTINMPDDRYVVDYSRASDDILRQTLVAQPVADIDRTFSLREVRENERVRALVPRIDLDAINFDTGSAAIKQSEARDLAELGQTMSSVIQQNPREIFLVEGHTDAVGSNLMNLALSDRRAEAVALALTEYYDIPPENLVVQGYGERFLKVQTEGPSQENRRATVRRITPLIERVASNN